MAYFKGLALALALVLGACSSGVKKEPSGTIAADGEHTEAPLEKIPNPYLQSGKTAPPAATQAFAKAQAAMQAQRWRDASEVLQTLTETHPELSGPWVNLGIVHWQTGELAKAEASFNKALTINPLNNEAYNQLGVLLREQGRFQEALSVYQKALEVWPHAPATLRNLGILYDLYMGEFEKALAAYELALRLAEGDDIELQGWIIDLKRRLASEEGNG